MQGQDKDDTTDQKRGDASAIKRADESAMPFQTSNQLFFVVPAQAVVARWLSTFKEFPPRQTPASFNVDAVVEKIMSAAAQGPGR